MSSFLYGKLSRRRLDTEPDFVLTHYGIVRDPARGDISPPSGQTKETVSHWQDVLAALVPAEVLAVHALAMTLGTSSVGEGENATTTITAPTEMTVVFWGMATGAFVLYVAGVKSLRPLDIARGLVASAAFVLWTMISPSTAFDALGWDPSTLLRVMTAIAGAAVLGIVVNLLASSADDASTTT